MTKFKFKDINAGLLLILFVAFMLPWILFKLNPVWTVNRHDIDVWFYYGYFNNGLDFWSEFSPSEALKYYGTRLPIILPGHIFYMLFGNEFGRNLFKFGFIFPITIVSFSYFLTRHFSIRVSALIVSMLAIDIYFLRSQGNDYIDNGVIFYQSISFALISCYFKEHGGKLFAILAGFSALSMIFVHLLSAILMPVFLAYAIIFSSGNGCRLKNFSIFLVNFSIGMLLCFLFYGLVSKLILSGDFLFFLPHILIFFKESANSYLTPFRFILNNGYWLTIILGVAVSSALAIFHTKIFKQTLLPFERFALFSLIATLLVLRLLAPDGLQFLLGRDGLYATFFYLLAYMALAVLLFRSKDITEHSFFWLFLFLFAITAFRFTTHIFDLKLNHFPMYLLAFLLSILTYVAFTLPKKYDFLRPFIAGLLGVLMLFVPMLSEDVTTVPKAYDLIRSHTENRVPSFFWKRDGRNELLFRDISATFTEKGWFKHGWDFPECHSYLGGSLSTGDFVVVLSDEAVKSSEYEKFSSCVGSALLKVNQYQINQLNLQHYYLTIYQIKNFKKITLDASSLPGLVGKSVGKVRESETGSVEGVLSFGPYLNLSPGSYQLTFQYAAIGHNQKWDIVYNKGANLISSGYFEDSNGKVANKVVDFVVESPIENLEARTFYQGHGELTLINLTLLAKHE